MSIFRSLGQEFAEEHLMQILDLYPFPQEASICFDYPLDGYMTVALPFHVLSQCTCLYTNKLCRTPVYEYCHLLSAHTIEGTNVFIMNRVDYERVYCFIRSFGIDVIHVDCLTDEDDDDVTMILMMTHETHLMR